jgi:hypothetical protein
MGFLKKLRPFDLIILGILILCILVGILTFTGRRVTSSKQIEATVPVEIDIFFRGVSLTSDNSPFKEGDETFITIRNVPYSKLKISKVSFERKKTMLPSSRSSSGYIIAEDVSTPFQYDFLVKVTDEAKMTKDGAVVGGNKIKIGLPVTLEGLDYRLNGLVSNITINNPKEEVKSKAQKTAEDGI